VTAERLHGTHGLTLLELLFALAIGVTLAGISVPVATVSLDYIRTASAARYMAGRLMSIRMEAIRRSTAVALRFEPSGADYVYAAFEDRNGNGVRSADILAGIDRRISEYERVGHKFGGVRFALLPGTPDVDGVVTASEDGVRIAVSRILTMTPEGSCTAGTLYLAGRRGQYAVRALGATGRTRVLQFDPGARTWTAR
jgi:type II secretory pathway pseudopilin PulG